MRTLIAFRFAFLVGCVWMVLNGNNPPVQAQQMLPVLTVKDAVQDHDISSLEKDVEDLKVKQQAQWSAIQNNSNLIAGMQGEERGIGALLGLIQIASIVVQVRKK